MDKYEIIKSYNEILDESDQLIQVCDKKDFSVLYSNRSARTFFTGKDIPPNGEKCYKYVMGLDEQCPFCPIRQIGDKQEHKTEIDNGQQIFSVKTRLMNWQGKDAFIEYATDITAIKRAQNTFDSQMKKLVDSIPEAQGIFHINLTKDMWLSSNGVSAIVEELRQTTNVNALVESLSSYIPDEIIRKRVYHDLCRESLLDAFSKGRTEIPEEAPSYYDDGSIRWSRITARLIMNPSTGDVEGIIYGMDISEEWKYREQMVKAEHEKEIIQAKSKQDILTGIYNKAAFIELSNDYLRVRPKQSFAVIFIDLDNFKAVNDNLGHLFGDKVIIEMAETLQSIYSNRDLISRFGEDEYCLLVKCIQYDDLVDRLDSTLKKMAKTYTEDDIEVNVSASIGVAYCDGHAKDIMEWIEKADMALYHAKRNGRNQYHISK